MTLGLCFWITFLIWLVLGLWASWPFTRASGGSLLLIILIVLLGWQVFGPAIHR